MLLYIQMLFDRQTGIPYTSQYTAKCLCAGLEPDHRGSEQHHHLADQDHTVSDLPSVLIYKIGITKVE